MRDHVLEHENSVHHLPSRVYPSPISASSRSHGLQIFVAFTRQRRIRLLASSACWFHLISLSESDQNFLATSSQPPRSHIVSEFCILECLLACIADWGIQDVRKKPGKCKAEVGEGNHVGNCICGMKIEGGDSEKAKLTKQKETIKCKTKWKGIKMKSEHHVIHKNTKG